MVSMVRCSQFWAIQSLILLTTLWGGFGFDGRSGKPVTFELGSNQVRHSG